MYAVDVHCHTRFFHGFGPRPTAFDPVGVRLLDAFARRRGLDGFAVTNHDYRFERAVPGATAIPGIELSTTRGHVLVIGPDPPAAVEPGVLEPREAVDLAHEHGCAAVLAHPFRNSTVRETDAPVDAIEVNGKSPEHVGRVTRLARERDLPLVGGSDAHYPFAVGRAYTRVDAPTLSPDSLVAAIRDGRVEATLGEHPIDRLLWPVYDRIHRFKGHVPRVPEP